jgi:hypothetical protein
MKNPTTLFFLALIFCAFAFNSKAQTTMQGSQNLPAGGSSENGISHTGPKKGTFFITPFYEFTSFKKLELVAHTNHYNLWEGESSYTYSDEEITEYNNTFSTEYLNSMTGIKIGYHFLDGLGVSGYVGINHFNFNSWKSDASSQSHGSDNPALTLGVAMDYQKAITEKLTAMSILSYNYCKTATVDVDNNAGEDITSSSFKSMYWEINLALAYHYKKLMPFAGVDFTQQFVNAVHEEKIAATNDLGEDVFNLTEFDSNFKGSAIYGFAGLAYYVSKNLSVYGHCSFINPVRANLGIKIVL